MKKRILTEATKSVRCAIYTRKSTEEGLDQEFNSLDAQRESAEAFIVSQRHEGWEAVTESNGVVAAIYVIFESAAKIA
jgi:site-specific DNA recombinase